MAVSLREVLDDELNLDTAELIEDATVQRMYNKAVHWYRKYRMFPRTNTCNYSIESGDYVPDILMGQEVEVEEGGVLVKKKLSEAVDTKTRVFNGTGTITVTFALTSDNAWLAGLPHELENLFAAYCKKAIGQRLKFAKYPSQPFDLDGDALFSEGESERKEWEEFIMVNRDEDPENITDLRNEAYDGVRGNIFLGGGMRLW